MHAIASARKRTGYAGVRTQVLSIQVQERNMHARKRTAYKCTHMHERAKHTSARVCMRVFAAYNCTAHKRMRM
eukprot:14208422-Alexandrium_andersonii.AAC.1